MFGKVIFVNLFFLLFMGFVVLFDTIYESHYTISANFYIYLQYFQQKNFNFIIINRSQTDHKNFHFNLSN